MPRTPIAAQAAPGGYNYNGATLTFTPADVANMNECVATGKELIIVRNVNAGVTVRNFTLTSVADSRGRTGNATKAIDAAGYQMFGPVPLEGWASGGKLQFQGDHAEVEIAIVRVG